MTRKLALAAGTLAIAGFVGFFAASAAAQSATPAASSATPAAKSAGPASLADQLTTKFKLVKLGSRGQVVLDPGTVLTVQKGGLVGFHPWLPKVCPSSYKDGKMNSPNSWCLMAARDVTHDLTKGEKVYVENIDVDRKNDKIEFKIVECDSCNGNRSVYTATLEFHFSKGQLKSTDVDKITGVIGEVFAVDAPEETTQPAKTEPVQQSPPADAQTAVNQPVPQPSPTPAVPPAPAPPIQVGQTLEEVQTNAGVKLNPIADLGNKQIYRYNGEKIIVENGIVTSVQ